MTSLPDHMDDTVAPKAGYGGASVPFRLRGIRVRLELTEPGWLERQGGQTCRCDG